MSAPKRASNERWSVSAVGLQPCASTIHSRPLMLLNVNTGTNASATYYWAPPHSGQNFADFGTGLPQLIQNFAAADGAAGATGEPPAGCGAGGAPGSGGRIAFIMV